MRSNDRILEEFQGEEADLAEQLLALRQSPSRHLMKRLQAIPDQPEYCFWSKLRWALKRKPRLAWGVAVLLILTLLFVSPAAQATLGQIETMIGHIRLTMLDTYPEPTQTRAIESVSMTLAEARAAVPYSFGVPTYQPPSLVEPYEVLVTPLAVPLVRLRWRDTEGGFVQLTAQPQEQGVATKTLVGTASGETISLNGQAAVLVRGAWNETSRTWDKDSGIVTLIWQIDDTQYRLLSYSDLLSSAELAKMAESVPGPLTEDR